MRKRDRKKKKMIGAKRRRRKRKGTRKRRRKRLDYCFLNLLSKDVRTRSFRETA
jgi:hypothetical protein